MGNPGIFQISSTVLGKAKEIVHKEGTTALLSKALRRLKKLFWDTNCSVWFERDLTQAITHFSPEIDVSIEFLVKDKKKLVNWLESKHKEYPWIFFVEEIEAANRNEHIFVTLTQHNRIVGYVKVGINQVYINDFNTEVSFPPNAAFIYDTFVLPNLRGKRLALFALNETMKYLDEHKYKRLLCHIEKWNVPSIKTFENAGFVSKGELRYLNVAGIPCYMQNRYSPFWRMEKFLRTE